MSARRSIWAVIADAIARPLRRIGNLYFPAPPCPTCGRTPCRPSCAEWRRSTGRPESLADWTARHKVVVDAIWADESLPLVERSERVSNYIRAVSDGAAARDLGDRRG